MRSPREVREVPAKSLRSPRKVPRSADESASSHQLIRRWRRLQCRAFVHAILKAHAKRTAD
eukprot:2683553-Prymnesium_polylepis.1